MVNISHGSAGVAARACGLVNLDPARVSSPGSFGQSQVLHSTHS